MEKEQFEQGSFVPVTKSKIYRDSSMDGVIEHSCRIYVDCDCMSNKHMARVVVNKRIERSEKEPNKWYIVDDDVYVEFNATNNLYPVNDEPLPLQYGERWSIIKKLFVRVKAAIRLVLGQEVYFCSDILLNHDSARKLAEAIIETVDAMKDAK
jgi:hypothetical protein